MSKVTTVIFDFYETLALNNTGLWIDTFRDIRRVQGLDIDPEVLFRTWKTPELQFRKDRLNLQDPDKSPPFKSYQEAWQNCFRQAFSILGLRGDATAAAIRTIRDMGLREPYQDAVEALPLIQARWRTGILSNADDGYLLPLIDRLGWKFDAVLSSEGARAYKPLPGPFRQIMGELGVEPGEAIYVGDTLYDDIVGAQGVGMKAAWINRHESPPDPQFPRPDYEIRSLHELPGVLEQVG